MTLDDLNDRDWFVYWDEKAGEERIAVWPRPSETDVERVRWLIEDAKIFAPLDVADG